MVDFIICALICRLKCDVEAEFGIRNAAEVCHAIAEDEFKFAIVKVTNAFQQAKTLTVPFFYFSLRIVSSEPYNA